MQTYQRFAAARRRITYPSLKISRILLFGVITSITVLPVVFSRTFDLTIILASLDVFWPWVLSCQVLFILLSLALGIGHIIGGLVFSLVGAFVVDAEAVRFFCISHLQRREIMTLSLRSALLNTLPVILFFEAIALPFLYFPPASVSAFLLSKNPLPVQMPFALLLLLFFSALCVVGTIGVVVYAVFDAHLYAFTNALQPMTQTPWAHLAPRIAAYARLAGVEFSSIQVQQDLLGTFNVGCLGLRKPMLFISEFFLRHSEWRQQDAIVSLVIGLAKKQVNRYMLLSKLASSVVAIACIVIVPLLGNVAFLQGLEPIRFITFFLLSLIGVLALCIGTSSYLWRLQTRNYREADRIASYLTGDPAALMVALDVLYAFDGKRLDYYSEQTCKLDELAHQSWPHAPQASLPVPAVFALGFGSRYLSTSLDQATSPDPVPTTPYQNLPD
ncbi:hypothetical protein KSF_000880 [Reticulibacter mediterranei]|uniref:Uncharacterized protein n=1 Tax=Reticulibacter mediterranei TaxID=2778369 RepID=A0A8J3MZB9_9CHLR|nr:hypothetical protein KSF_000880 [Reticulibacter mediterranei]